MKFLGFKLNKERLINSLKTALGCLIAFAIIYYFNLPLGAWILITVIVVMGNQINVGGVVSKSIIQFFGVVIGTLISILLILLYGDKTLALTITLFISIFIFSYMASSEKEYHSAGLLGATTLIVILFSQDPSYQTAFYRFFEISTGILIAFIVSKFIVPIHAYQKIYTSMADVVDHFVVLYQTLWQKKEAETDPFSSQEEEVITIFSKQRELVNEAMNELSTRVVNRDTYAKILNSQRQVFRYICLMHQALEKSPIPSELMPHLGLFNDHVIWWLEQLSRGLKAKDFKLESNKISTRELIPLLQGLNAMPLPSSSHQLAVDAFFFCAISLVRELRRLTRLSKIVINHRNKKE